MHASTAPQGPCQDSATSRWHDDWPHIEVCSSNCLLIKLQTHGSERMSTACSFGWCLMAGADLFWEKSTVGWLLVAGLFWEKSTAGWWLISQTNRVLVVDGRGGGGSIRRFHPSAIRGQGPIPSVRPTCSAHATAACGTRGGYAIASCMLGREPRPQGVWRGA
jgi:hypothetical protein